MTATCSTSNSCGSICNQFPNWLRAGEWVNRKNKSGNGQALWDKRLVDSSLVDIAPVAHTQDNDVVVLEVEDDPVVSNAESVRPHPGVSEFTSML